MNEIIIRDGKKEDVDRALELIKELAAYERAPHKVSNTAQAMLSDGFGEVPCYKLMVAEYRNQIVGIAISFIKYSTWTGKGVFLEDLIVTESMRGKGVGKLLFEEVIRYARAVNAKQMHWQVLEWNAPAIEFYKKYHAQMDDEWVDCKIYF